ncbi:MAG TPA: hypothetical protein VF865_00330, partial [Acidobacteriaceae bacterium]
MDTDNISGAKRSASAYLTATTLFLATAAFTLWQNTRVAVLWDLSYLLDSSFRISLGQVPYRDFPFAHAPLTFLVQAMIIKLAGRVYFVHVIYAALAGGAATVLTWRILLNLLQPLAGRAWLLSTLLAAPLIFLGIYGIYPHPVYDSDCLLAVLAAIWSLQRAGEARTRNFLAGALCVLPLFYKQNIGLPFLAIAALSVAVVAIVRRVQVASIAPQLCLFGGACAALTAALLILHATAGLHNYFYWTITFAAQRRLPGLSVVLGTYHQTSLLWTVPAAAAAIALLRSHGLHGKRWTQPVALLLLAGPFLWTIAALFLTDDPDDRGDQLLSLWPHLLILAVALAASNLRPRILSSKTSSTLNTLLPLIVLATIHGAFLSQQLWGSTYATWPLLTLLVASLLIQIPAIAQPFAAIVAATFLLCGGLYTTSHERVEYIHLDGAVAHATVPELKGLATPGPWIPGFEELIRFASAEIPAGDGVLLIPGENPFYFATGRTPQFPVLLFDPA